MEVVVGTSFGIDLAAVFDREPAAEPEETQGVEFPEDLSDSSSSIGAPGDSSEEEVDSGDDTVSSKAENSGTEGLSSLTSLEDTLPIKRGLSNHLKGKSKSFANLSEVTTMKELEKVEHPLNKKRRVLISNKWRRSSFYSWQSPKSMPLLALDEAGEHRNQSKTTSNRYENPRSSSSDDDDDDDEDEEIVSRNGTGFRKGKKKPNLKTQSCYALADLHEEEEDD